MYQDSRSVKLMILEDSRIVRQYIRILYIKILKLLNFISEFLSVKLYNRITEVSDYIYQDSRGIKLYNRILEVLGYISEFWKRWTIYQNSRSVRVYIRILEVLDTARYVSFSFLFWQTIISGLLLKSISCLFSCIFIY